MRLNWQCPEDILVHEFVQRAAEGSDITAQKERWRAAGGPLAPSTKGTTELLELRPLARELLAEIYAQPIPADPQQPDDLDAILALASPVPDLPTDIQPDRIAGAWLGRAAGCLLGKPVETLPRQAIIEILQSQGRWPLTDWFTGEGLDPDVATKWPWNPCASSTLIENVTGMAEDDDLNYPILAHRLVAESGRDFTTTDVALLWLRNLPAGMVFTAERATYRNLLNTIPVDEAGLVNNPYREWIGALIRGDAFGWFNPGDPVTAAAMAHRDAFLSHRRNGIYGEMWAAGLCAAAVVTSDLDTIFAAGDAVVPQQSDLAKAVREARQIARDAERTDEGNQQGLEELHARWGHLHWIHTVNNAASIAYALEYARTDCSATSDPDSAPIDFATAITTVVMAGWDTDSSGATVGSVAGAMLGQDRLPRHWIDPLRDSIQTSVPFDVPPTFTGLIEQTIALASQR